VEHSPRRFRSPAGAILLCDLHRPAAQALLSREVAGPFPRHFAEPIGFLEHKHSVSKIKNGSARRREKGPLPGEVSARAANRLRSHSKIVAQKSPQGRAGQYCVRPAFEHTIWQSEVRRKGGSRGRGTSSPTCLKGPLFKF
jgi:hypothetical protein